MINDKEQARQIYAMINEKANSNVVVQGLTGILGFPYTLIADGAVLFTHYSTMLNQIRERYERKPVSEKVVVPILRGSSEDLLFDLLADKLLGQIPLVGIYFNVICAKTLTWRLGILFALLSRRGEEINEESVREMVITIREMFPQEDSFKFHQPTYQTFEDLLLTTPFKEYDDKNYTYTYEG